MITLHQIWFNRSGQSLPGKCAMFRQEWASLNPDFALKLWGLSDLHDLKDVELSRQLDDPSLDESMVCNRARALIVYLFGGLYADVDTKPVRPFGNLLSSCGDFMVGELSSICPVNKKRCLEMNLFYSVAGHSALESVLSLADGTRRSTEIQQILRQKHEQSLDIRPVEYFQSTKITANTYSLHWPHRLASWRKDLPKSICHN